MITEAPDFLIDEHFRRNRDKRWKFTTLRTTCIILDVPFTEKISFRDKHGIEWMWLEPHAGNRCKKTIREGYSWDGATRAPDFPAVLLASLVHDADYQFQHTQHFPFSRLECDIAFYDLMRLKCFPLALPYFSAVRTFGSVFKGNDGEWSKLLAVSIGK